MKLGGSQSLYRAILGQQSHSSRARVQHHVGRVKESAFSLGLWTRRCATADGGCCPLSKSLSRRWWWGRERCGWFLVQFFGYGRPCDHAATSFCSSSMTCPSFSSSTEWWTFLLCGRDVYPQCKLCSCPQRLTMCRSWGWFLTGPLLCINKCVAEVPVIMQRQVPAI